MSYYIVSDELYHHGILGMHWGVRRYQNPDGSLTTAGRERYASKDVNTIKSARDKYLQKGQSSKYIKKVQSTRAYKEAYKLAEKEMGSKEVPSSISNMLKKHSSGQKLTKEELNEAYKYVDTYANNHARAVSKGENFLNSYLGKYGKEKIGPYSTINDSVIKEIESNLIDMNAQSNAAYKTMYMLESNGIKLPPKADDIYLGSFDQYYD